MQIILELLKEITVQFLQVLKEKFSMALFILQNVISFFLLGVIFGYINAALFGVLPFSEITWWQPIASGLGVFIGIIRGLWDNVVNVPGTLYFHIRVTTHCFLVMAPASAILLNLCTYVGVIQSWFFVTGLFSDDPLDRNFNYFLKRNRVLLLALLCITIMIAVYILFYDPVLPSAKCPSNQENLHELLRKNFISLLAFTPKVTDQRRTKITTQLSMAHCVLFAFLTVFLIMSLAVFVYCHFFECGLRFLSPEIWHFNRLMFQQPSSLLMERLIALHSDIWAIMLFVAGFVLYMACATLYSPNKNDTTYLCPDFASGKGKGSYTSLDYWIMRLGFIVWKNQYNIVLCISALALLFNILENSESIYNVMVSEGQHPFHQYNQYSSNSTSMASPGENTRWFKGLKNWWFSDSNQPLSPIETNQKTLDTLQKAQGSVLDRCRKHDDTLLGGSLSPRSHGIMVAKRDECYFHYDALSKCVHQVSLDVARTQYNSLPTTFAGSFGNALGQTVGIATESLYTEMAKNAVTSTADELSSYK